MKKCLLFALVLVMTLSLCSASYAYESMNWSEWFISGVPMEISDSLELPEGCGSDSVDISWTFDGKPLSADITPKEMVQGNLLISRFDFVPTAEDDGKSFVCTFSCDGEPLQINTITLKKSAFKLSDSFESLGLTPHPEVSGYYVLNVYAGDTLHLSSLVDAVITDADHEFRYEWNFGYSAMSGPEYTIMDKPLNHTLKLEDDAKAILFRGSVVEKNSDFAVSRWEHYYEFGIILNVTPVPSSSVPQTGDAAQPLLWSALALTALAGMLLLCRRRVCR